MTGKDSEYWDEAYKKGVHWEEGHSKGAEEFSEMLKPKSSVLDIGCGSGRDCIFFAKKGFDVAGVDISEEAIKKAKQTAGKEGLKIRFELMSAEKLSYGDESFDGVYSNSALHFTDLKRSSEEIFRVLKKNGVCLLSIVLTTTYPHTNEVIKKYSAEQAILAFGKFKMLKQNEIEVTDEKPRLHKHKILVLVLKK
ncbi:MAG: class I SAM-dependent methyltransferase [Candidatus Aenigmatarchaeota archaeon]